MSASQQRWWLVIALLLSLGVNIGIVTLLAVHRLRPPETVQRPSQRTLPTFERAADRLRLEGEKREQFLAIHREFVVSMREAQTRVARLRRELRQQLAARRPDQASIDRTLTELGQAYAELDEVTVRTVLASRELLDGRQERMYLRVLSRLRGLARGEARPRPGERPGPPPNRP